MRLTLAYSRNKLATSRNKLFTQVRFVGVFAKASSSRLAAQLKIFFSCWIIEPDIVVARNISFLAHFWLD